MRRRIIAVTAVNAALLLTFWYIASAYGALTRELQSQRTWERFAGESGLEHAQVSAYFAEGSGMTFEQIRSLRRTVETTLTAESIEPVSEGAALWLDAFSVTMPAATVTTERRSTTVNVLAVGGDFFAFHPYRRISGGYVYSDDDALGDRVVLDSVAAWNLFGSGNVEGLVVTINVDGEAREFRVAGVVELERDSASTRAFEAQFGTTQACVFIPYIAYDPEGSKLTYTTYECVTREPFGGFLYNVFNGTQSAPRPGVLSGAEIVQNSGRFEVSKTYENLKTFAERTLRHSEVVYPYWENAAILVENRLVAPLVIGAICLLAPILTLVFLFGWGLKKTQGKWRVLVEFGGDALDVWRRYAWNRKLRKRERLENSRLEPGDIVPDNSANEE